MIASLKDPKELLSWAAHLVRELNKPTLIPTGTVTLRANETTTDIANMAIRVTSVVLLWPTTANASAEIGAGTIYTSNKGTGKATLTHANNAQTDRKFDYVVI